MADRAHPYAHTRAAALLDQGLKQYTAQHRGGLRALAIDLGIKQATVLSHMANGRIGIPLDRATELASRLGMDVVDFSMAVLEQRSPPIHQVLAGNLPLEALRKLPQRLLRILNRAGSRASITDEHVTVITEVLATENPAQQWMHPLEGDIIRLVREQFPAGITLTEALEVIDWIKLMPTE